MKFDQVVASVFDAIPDETARAYRDLFDSENGKLVLAHLAHTCHATRTTMIEEEPLVAEGRRQVFLMIQDCLALDERDLRALQRAVVERFGQYE